MLSVVLSNMQISYEDFQVVPVQTDTSARKALGICLAIATKHPITLESNGYQSLPSAAPHVT